jgi:hypothetical protein
LILESTHAGTDRLVHLRFKPLWLYVDAVREFCGFFARATFENEAVGQRVGLIVHELLENAVRYGDEKELEVRFERSNDAILISVVNTTTDERAGKLRALFEEMTTLTPVAAYNRALTRSASLPATESGLGLSRVRYEGQVELQLETSPGRVSITARGNT